METKARKKAAPAIKLVPSQEDTIVAQGPLVSEKLLCHAVIAEYMRSGKGISIKELAALLGVNTIDLAVSILTGPKYIRDAIAPESHFDPTRAGAVMDTAVVPTRAFLRFVLRRRAIQDGLPLGEADNTMRELDAQWLAMK